MLLSFLPVLCYNQTYTICGGFSVMRRFPILLSAILTGAVCFGSLSASAVEIEIVEIEEVPDVHNPQDSVVIQLPEPPAVTDVLPASPKETTYARGVAEGLYEISSAQNSDYVLDIRNCTVRDKDDGTAQLFRSMDVNQQKFYAEAIPDGYFRIRALHTGGALSASPENNSVSIAPENVKIVNESTMTTAENITITVENSSAALENAAITDKNASTAPVGSPKSSLTSTDVAIYSERGDASDTESWIIEKALYGYCYIKTEAGQYLTLDNSRPYSGDPVVLRDYTGELSQMWKFEHTRISAEDSADTDLVNPYGEDGPYSGLRLALQFDTQTEAITAKELAAHTSENENHEFVLDPAYLDTFITQLAEKYDVQGKPMSFHTSGGDEITVYAGDTGQKLDCAETRAMLEKYLETNQVQFLTPVWEKKAATAKENERGKIEDGYVEIDLENQKVYLYKDGKKLLETDCVSGNSGDPDCETPDGVYYVYYKASPDTLDGPGYSEFVNFWMPFYGNYGLHDATWRDEFGGTIYKGDGSHGCVNLPLDAARVIYNTVDIGYPVVLYR